MHSRVKPEYKQASGYFARGITVCARWADYSLFLQDMGECPDGLSLDRIDNDKGYEPSNCRWASAAVQRRNSRRVIIVTMPDGSSMHLKDAADAIGVSDTAIYQDRKRHGGSIQNAFDRVAARQ